MAAACELCRQGHPLRMMPDYRQEHVRAYVEKPHERGHREEVLGPCTDPEKALKTPEAKKAQAQAERRTLSEMTNRIRAFGPRGNGKAFAEQSQPREPGEDDDEP